MKGFKMKMLIKTLVVSVLMLSSLQAGDVKLSLEKTGVEINAGSAGKFILQVPTLGAVGNDGFENPVVEVSGKKATAKYPSGALLEMELAENEISCTFWAIPDHANSWMFVMTIPGKFSDGGKFGLGGKPIEDFPAVAGTSQFLTTGNTAKTFTLLGPGGDGFSINATTNWYGMQDNRAKGWGNQFVYSFLYDIRAYPGVTEFKIQIGRPKP
jgi:hypothetical protein